MRYRPQFDRQVGYPDLVLGTIVVAFSLTGAVLGALGVGEQATLGVGSVFSMGVLSHALFVNPPPYTKRED